MRTLTFVLAALGVLAAPAGAEQYWIAYEGNDFPENEGWIRYWGDWEGPYHGGGAIRTIEDGILTMDSLFDTGVYDYAYLERPGQVDPGPGEVFVMEWRAVIEDTTGEPTWDAAVMVASDAAWMLTIGLCTDEVVSSFEGVTIPIAPGVFHDYRVLSPDMRGYQLYVDGEVALLGSFWRGLTESRLAWGPGSQGVSTLSHWDYVRMGVIPEPASLVLLLVCITRLRACARRAYKGG
jgi:hypothetical protein